MRTSRWLYERRWPIGAVVGYLLSRAGYWLGLDVHFEAGTLNEYMQIADPELLRTDLFRTIYYLRDQPPLFNLVLGATLKLFPRSYPAALHGIFILLGAWGVLAAYQLGRRLHASERTAAAGALALFGLPCAALYENWLFYAYPVGVLFIVAANAMAGLLRRPSARRSLAAFSALAAIALMRGTFHLFLVLGLGAAVTVIRHRQGRQIALGFLLPLSLLTAVYAKHWILFHDLVIGGFYKGVNLSMMQMRQIKGEELPELRATLKISPACPGGFHSHVDLQKLLQAGNLPQPQPTGVPILDNPWKSTGATNWQSSAAELIGKSCGEASVLLRRARPDAYWRAVWENLNRYPTPADRTWPFLRTGLGNNADKLRSANTFADRVLGLQLAPNQQSNTVIIGFLGTAIAPAVYGARIARGRRWRWRLLWSTNLLITLLVLMVFIYASLVVLLFSTGDHNRYRAEIMPLLWVVNVGVASELFRRLRRRWRRAPIRSREGAS